jgi:membrane-bound lytic murein transglycosylase A
VPQPAKEPPRESRFERLQPGEWPALQDDMDLALLQPAIEKSLVFYGRIPDDRMFPLGDAQIPASLLKETLALFLEHLNTGRLDPASLSQSFDLYGLRPIPGNGGALVTGYYEPVLDGSLTPDTAFRYPLYSVPPDLVTIEPGSFDPDKFPAGEKWVGRLQDSRVLPYFTRSEIDFSKTLEGANCHLVWLKDPVDAFFLHIQGSGVIRFPDGRLQRVGYAGANGRPYRSVGKLLIDRGLLPPEGVSMQVIRDFIKSHPELQSEILSYNESYVFFRWVDKGPVGSLSVVLTEGRSVAMDARIQPRGALAFLDTSRPRLSPAGDWIGSEPMSRWVLNQDAGGAIKGPGRVDLFCGTGDGAEQWAGRMKYPGKVYFLLKKTMQ